MIPRPLARALTVVGLRSRDLIYPGQEGSGRGLDGLCYLICEVILAEVPGVFWLAKCRAPGPNHYFLVHHERQEVFDMVLALKHHEYQNRRRISYRGLSKRGNEFHSRVKEYQRRKRAR